MARLIIPEILIKYTKDVNELHLPIKQLLDLPFFLQKHYSALYAVLFDAQGNINSFINFYLNDTTPIFPDKESRKELSETDTLTIIASISGG